MRRTSSLLIFLIKQIQIVLAVRDHADVSLILAQDIRQEFLAAHVLDTVAAPAISKIAGRLKTLGRIHLWQEMRSDNHPGNIVFLAADSVQEVAETAALDDEFAIGLILFFATADLCRDPLR